MGIYHLSISFCADMEASNTTFCKCIANHVVNIVIALLGFLRFCSHGSSCKEEKLVIAENNDRRGELEIADYVIPSRVSPNFIDCQVWRQAFSQPQRC